MNVKKIAAVGASAVIYLASAAPAFATFQFPWWGFGGSDELSIHNEDTYVKAEVTTKANTGGNDVEGEKGHRGWFWWWGGNDDEAGTIETGDAAALAEVGQMVNMTDVAGCGCFDDVSIHNEDTTVKADVYTKANSGYNWIGGAGSIMTGAAAAASVVSQMVNVTVVGE